MISLKTLLPDYPHPLPDLNLTGLTPDSRQAGPGLAFLAVPGARVDGRDFINDAVAAGVVVVLAEADEVGVRQVQQIPVIQVPDLSQQLSALAGRFYGQPSGGLQLTGVTGTNGKTTVSQLVGQLWEHLEPPAAVLGTIGAGLLHNLQPSRFTTPDAVTTQQQLAEFRHAGVRHVAMEVSSHALAQGRVTALTFAAVVATNVSRDHLDYHGDMTAYKAAKRRLFEDFAAPVQIINADDPEVATWGHEGAWRFSLDPQLADQPRTLVATQLEFTATGTRLQLAFAGSRQWVQSSLLGAFNVANLLAALLVPLAAGHSLVALARLVPLLRPVPGRMEAFTRPGGPLVLVDYAHTPMALEQVLQAAGRHCAGQLWCVFGCGGDRDRGKRPQMGEIAARYADEVVVTDDNPRTEEPLAIIQDIVSGMPPGTSLTRQPGRQQAVCDTIGRAGPDDVVVLAGKGHEDYQVLGTQRVQYDERKLVAGLLGGEHHETG